MRPSILGLCFAGLIILIAIIYIIYCLCTMDREPLDRYQIIMILLVLAIAASLHGLAHNYAEVSFNYNPLQN